MLGLTSGAIRIDCCQDEQLLAPTSKRYFHKKEIYADQNEESEPEQSNIDFKGSLVQSDEDNEHEDCSDGSAYEGSERHRIERVHGMVTLPNEKDLDNLDWDRFYSTGEFALKRIISNTKAATNVPEQGVAEESSIAKESKAWKKRRRVQNAQKREAFRLPRGMGTVERAMRRYCEKWEGNIFEPYPGLEFDSEAEAFEYYNLYSWEMGFGIRKGKLDTNKDGYQRVRELVCQRQGFDKRTKTKTKRCNCMAMIRLHRTEDDGWFVLTFVKEHNHQLSATNEEKKEWSSHGVIDQASRNMIKVST